MRYADTPTTDVELHIDAAPERVWDFVTDIHLIAEVSPEVTSVRWMDDAAGPSVGARFMGRNFHQEVGEWETTSIVIDCERPRVFGWAVTDADHPSAVWRFVLRPDGAGTVLSQWVRLGPGPSGLTFAIERRPDKEERIIERRLAEFRTAMTANLVRIKEVAET